jgi:hypothetical protein
VDLILPPYSWDQMVNTYINLESNESSAPGASNKGFCSEAIHIRAAGHYPVEQEACETPLIGEEHLPLSI